MAQFSFILRVSELTAARAQKPSKKPVAMSECTKLNEMK